MIVKGIPNLVNGNDVITFTNSKAVKAYFGETDLQSLSSWYEEDPDKHHLGLINLFRGVENYPIPMYVGMIKNGATISVNGPNGTFRYDMPVSKSDTIQTILDLSDQYMPGRDGGIFKIALNHKFEANDILTYSAARGCQIMVSGEWEVKKINGGWLHYVRMISMDKVKYFPKDFLKAGVKYWKVTDGLGEYSTQFSSVSGSDRAGTIKCEFQLGNHRGVESYTTMYAAMKRMSAATIDTQNFMDRVERRLYEMRQTNDGDLTDIAVITQGIRDQNGNIRGLKKGAQGGLIASTMEILALAELSRMEANELMFQRAGTIIDNNSVIRKNEGLYHQLRRGFTIKYSRRGGLTKVHLRNAAQYVFRNRPDIPITSRRMKFRCGFHAFNNVQEIFRDEIWRQLNHIPGKLVGTDRMINNPISGDNLNLKLNPIMFTGVYLDGIGLVDIEHDASLDFEQMTDRRMLIDGEYAYTSWSLIMEDITSTEYSNAFANIPDKSNAVLGNMNNNVFYVKPEGPSLFWGNSQGRYSSRTNSQILSSRSTMDESFWCHSMSACWVMDNSRMVLIELNEREY